jgi:hypothetical protein
MKKIYLIITMIMAVMSVNCQNIDLRANKESDKDLSKMRNITLNIPFSLLVPLIKPKQKPFIPFNKIKADELTSSSIPIFYPDILCLRNTNTPYIQRWFSKDAIKELQIIDIEQKVAVINVKRIFNGEVVKERRWLSTYKVVLIDNNNNKTVLDKVYIMANYDRHLTYPEIIPGGRYLFTNANDDPNSIFNIRGVITLDKGLVIDYDETSD